MASILHFLFGLSGDTQGVSSWHVTARGGYTALFWVLIAIVLCAASFTLYQREKARPRLRIVLIVLRSLLIMGLVGILLEPRVQFTVETIIRRSLPILVDDSASMSIADQRTDPADIRRASIALGSPATRPSREELVIGAMKNPKLDLLHRLSADQDLRPFIFADHLTESSGATDAKWLDQLHVGGRSTAMGDALRETMNRTRGQPLSGIMLITDGANNAGSAPAAAAEMAQQAHVPLYIWGVGLPAPKDIIVTSLFAPDVAFVDDQVTLTARIRSSRFGGQTVDVILKQDDAEVARQSVKLADGEQIVPLQFTPKKPGRITLTATVPPREDEVVKDNNTQTASMRVVDGKIKVLLIDQKPRWEFKYLQAMLLRDRRVDLKCWLQEADAGMSAAEGSIYLPKLPADNQALFAYDVIVIGDMDSDALTKPQLDALKRYVSEIGGSVVFIAGREHDPSAYRLTTLADLLPVELGPSSADSSDHTTPIHAELTAAGRAAGMLRLADTEAASDAIWADLAPIFFESPVSRAKPGAEVLAIDGDKSRGTANGSLPLIAMQQVGVGQVLFVGTDDTWRWRKNVGDKYYTLLWGQIVQRMALPHLLGESKRTRITLDKKEYSVGDRVMVTARLYGDGFEPLADPTVNSGYQTDVGGPRQPVKLTAMAGESGVYAGEFVATAEGSYTISVDRDPKTIEPFDVIEPKLEMGDTAMNESLLKQMATASGGAFLHEEDLDKLPDMLKKQTQVSQSIVEVPLWSSPIVFLFLVTVVTLEWILRKVCDLK